MKPIIDIEEIKNGALLKISNGIRRIDGSLAWRVVELDEAEILPLIDALRKRNLNKQILFKPSFSRMARAIPL